MSGLERERAVSFWCQGETLVGVLHLPSAPASTGVVIVVGGPQYRVGSHRQFVLLARQFAASGCATLRFDCRGMGDSDGRFPGFEHTEPDVAAAVNCLIHELPSIHRVVLWGLCDAALPMSKHARTDPRVAGVVLLNPWVRSDSGLARVRLKHYFLARLVRADFVRDILHGRINLLNSGRTLAKDVVEAFWPSSTKTAASERSSPLSERLAYELQGFHGEILIILAGRDLTAKEFEDSTRDSPHWRHIRARKQVTQLRIPEADHTFSRQPWRDRVSVWTTDWINEHIAT